MKKHLYALAVPVLMLAVQNLTYADLPPEFIFWQEIQPVSVASFTENETVLNSVSTVSVINQETLKRYGFANIAEAVETVAGFKVYRTYQKKGLATSRGILQEMYANKVLIMINNVPSWNACTGEGELDRVGIEDVERIEILKGPASVLYGSNAYTGAVNIVLKKPTKEKSTTEIIGGLGSGRGGFNGNIDGYRSGGSYSTVIDGLALFMAANSSNEPGSDFNFLDEGTSVTARQWQHVDEYYNLKNFTFNANYLGHSLLFNAGAHDEIFYGNNMTVASGMGTNHAVEGILTSYRYDWEMEKLKAKYSMTYDWNRRNFGRSADGDTRSEIVGSRFVNTLDANYNVWDTLNLELGADHEIRTSHVYNTYRLLANQVISENGMSQKSLREYSIFGQAGYTWQLLKVLLGTRYTQNQQFGSDLSSRGTLVCSLDQANSIKLIAGQSYRAPSFFETNFISPLPITIFGNTDLKPEKSNSIELAYLTSLKTPAWGSLFLQALGYYATYENDIMRARGTIRYNNITYTNVNIYQNAPKFWAKGAELELKYALASTQVFINGDYVLGDDSDKVFEASTGQYTYNFKYVPKYTISGGVTQDIGSFFASTYANYYALTHGPFADIPATYILSASVGYKNGPMTHTLSVRNLTDQELSDPEYVRRTFLANQARVNSVPVVRGQRIDYEFDINF